MFLFVLLLFLSCFFKYLVHLEGLFLKLSVVIVNVQLNSVHFVHGVHNVFAILICSFNNRHEDQCPFPFYSCTPWIVNVADIG